jgi:hypothetical protein
MAKTPSHWKTWKERRDENPARYLWRLARKRAKRLNIRFAITEKDIEVPGLCPVFNTPLKFGVALACNDSPSIDRFKPELGYVPGNICVISYRANELKRNCTVDELQKLIQWMLSLKMPGESVVRAGRRRGSGSGHIYKPKYIDRHGVKKEVSCFYIQYGNRGKQVRESTNSSDYEYAKKLLKIRMGHGENQ